MNRRATRLEPTSLSQFDALIADQPATERWELIRGRVLRMMVGARWEHHRIVQNLAYEIRRRFDETGSPCRVFTETFRLRDASSPSSLLPDVIVQYRPLPAGATALEDPTVVIEVLSDEASRRDREEKWAVYRTVPSLRHYVLVSRDSPRLEVHDRGNDDWAAPRFAEELDASLGLPAIESTAIPLRRIYRDVLC